jgi:Family of unknown function (DUF6221)
MGTDDLAAFLKARLDEDEAAAKATQAAAAEWFLGSSEDDDKRSIRYTGPSTLYPGESWDYCIADRVTEDAAAHIARHDPARVLREIEAKRAILAQWEAGPAGSPVLTFALHNLAAVYSDHPDYRQEWKP